MKRRRLRVRLKRRLCLGQIHCPECGYRPGGEVYTDCLPYHPNYTDRPKTVEEELDFFEVCGAGEGGIICPVERCGCVFNPEEVQI